MDVYEHEARTNNILQIIISIGDLFLATVGIPLIVVGQLGFHFHIFSSFISIVGPSTGLILLFFALNFDIFPRQNRDILNIFIVNITALLPGILLGFHTHPWHEVLRAVSIAGVGFAIAWSLSKRITERYGLVRNDLIYMIRTAILMLLAASAAYLYFLIPLVELVRY